MTNDEPEAARGCDPIADFDGFFRVEYPRIVSMTIVLTADREAARDVAQEALLRAFRDWERVSALERPGAWVRRVALNLVVDRARRLRSETTTLARSASPEGIHAEPLGSEFLAAVRALPERQRIATALFYVVDRSIDEIAASMGVSPGTVKTTLFQARRSLARHLSIEER